MNKISEIVVERRVKRIKQIVWSIVMALAVRYRVTSSAGDGTAAMPRAPAYVGEPILARPAVVSVCPRTLSGLWVEYQKGV